MFELLQRYHSSLIRGRIVTSLRGGGGSVREEDAKVGCKAVPLTVRQASDAASATSAIFDIEGWRAASRKSSDGACGQGTLAIDPGGRESTSKILGVKGVPTIAAAGAFK